MAQAVLEFLTEEYSLQHQSDRITSLHRDWSRAIHPNVAIFPCNGERRESVSRPKKRPRDAPIQLEQVVHHHGPPIFRCRRKKELPKMDE